MKTPKDFDYDLWTSTDGGYFIRIKSTGETCEVNQETMRLLRNEEKKLRRELQGVTVPVVKNKKKTKETISITILSLDYVATDDTVQSIWLEDTTDYEEVVVTKLMQEEFCKLLTVKQLDVYEKCLNGGVSLREYAKYKGVHKSSIDEAVQAIRKKAKKFFD